MKIQADSYIKAATAKQNQSLMTLPQLCEAEPAFTPGGVRHLIFTKGHALPGVYRFGRRILFDRAEFIAGIKAGSAAHIAGGKS